jgi:microcompartment protein CcmL/EutN
MTHPPALALLEFDSIASGIQSGDAMVKHAPVARILAGTVQPGHYLVLVTGDVASVEEAVKVGVAFGRIALRDHLFLPNVHPGVVNALHNERQPSHGDALGIIETRTVASAIQAADAALKGAMVELVQLRLGDGLGGKGLALVTGLISDVEAAVDLATSAIATHNAPSHLLHSAIIAQLHGEMQENIDSSGRFGSGLGWENG